MAFITDIERDQIMASKKMTSKTIVKKVIGDAKGTKVEFGKFNFESGVTEKLMDIAKRKSAVEVIIREIQENLPGTE